MARNGSGTYSLPAGNPFVTGSVISSTTMNNTLSDIAAALTASVANDGQTPILAPIDFNEYTTSDLNINVSAVTASVYTSVPLAIVNALENRILWDSESFDTASFHSPTVNPARFTIPKTGYYSLTASIEFAGNATGSRYMIFKINGVSNAALDNEAAAASGNWLSINTNLSLTAGDYVEVFVYQNSGGFLNVNATSGSYFSIFLIGQ